MGKFEPLRNLKYLEKSIGNKMPEVTKLGSKIFWKTDPRQLKLEKLKAEGSPSITKLFWDPYSKSLLEVNMITGHINRHTFFKKSQLLNRNIQPVWSRASRSFFEVDMRTGEINPSLKNWHEACPEKAPKQAKERLFRLFYHNSSDFSCPS